MTYRHVFLSVTIVTSVLVNGCFFVKAPDEHVEVQNVSLSPQPELEMSDELVRTRAGDMIALLPKKWVFLDTKGEHSNDILAVAVDPDYTMSAVFSSVPHGESSREKLDKEGLLGLARIAYSKHVKKSAGTAKLVGTYSTADLGVRKFGLFDFSAAAGVNLRTRCAVFTSSIGNHYEFALVPLTVSGKDVPPDADIQRVFKSILATIQY